LHISWMIAAESGWRALFAVDGEEVGRSRVIGWGSVEGKDGPELVGVIIDPNDPTRLVAASEVTDPSGGVLLRYAFSA
jgi:hypothetical protein